MFGNVMFLCLQAVARIFRFGQLKPTFIYRLLYCNTFEEYIHRVNIRKEQLFEKVSDCSFQRLYEILLLTCLLPCSSDVILYYCADKNSITWLGNTIKRIVCQVMAMFKSGGSCHVPIIQSQHLWQDSWMPVFYPQVNSRRTKRLFSCVNNCVRVQTSLRFEPDGCPTLHQHIWVPEL